jgi:large subunit ribosomal protein L35
MPKLKSNRGAAKRFKQTGNGRLKHRQGFRNHILTKKSQKRKRHLRGAALVCASDHKPIIRLLNGS